MISVNVKGAKEVERQLKSIEPKIARKIVRSSLVKAAAVIRKSARENAPVDTGNLKKSIKSRVLKKKKKHEFSREVRAFGDEENGKYYANMVEYGREGVPGIPFMRQAYDAKGKEAQDILFREIKSGIKEAIK